MEMSLADAILIATTTFVLVICALSLVVKIGFGKQIDKLVALREAQQKSLELSRGSTQETRERIEQANQRAAQNQARSDELHQRTLASHDRADQQWQRMERSQERWGLLLSRIEALVENLEKRDKV